MMRRLVLAAVLVSAFVLRAAPNKSYPYMGAVSADASGRVLFADHAERPAYLASVTKLMTALLVLEDVAAGRYGFFDRIAATPDVRYSEASWVGLKTGETMTVRDLLMALMVESANDAAIVLGVNSSGSVEGFVARMNARAKELGMTGTAYYNPNGLPPNARRRYPWKKFNVSTAADQLKLAVELIKHREIFEFTSVKTCDLIKTANGFRVSVTRSVGRPNRETTLAPGEKLVKQMRNHNNVMVKDKKKVFGPDGKECVDGLKTGYIDAGGSSLVLTGQQKGDRYVVVVLGCDGERNEKGLVVKGSSEVRDEQARRLLTDALSARAR